MPKMSAVWKFILAIALCEGAGIIGSVFTASAIPTWYASLNKPFFNPPNWIFGPVWTILYFLMGISLYLIWQAAKTKHRQARETGLQFFYAQLFFNILWSIVFFGSHSIFGGLLVIIILWVLIYKTIIYFSKVNSKAAVLLYPYLGWVGFATILNFSIWFLNR